MGKVAKPFSLSSGCYRDYCPDDVLGELGSWLFATDCKAWQFLDGLQPTWLEVIQVRARYKLDENPELIFFKRQHGV